MKKIFMLAMFVSTGLISVKAQTNTFPSTGNAGIGTTSPLASAALEMKSTSKGLLIPRMTKAQRDAVSVSAAAKGLLIYQTDNMPGFYYYNGTAWAAVTPKSKSWSLTGNAGTDSTVNFIGTTDAHPLVFRVNNVRAGFIGYGKSNTSFGYQALTSNTSGNYNTATGIDALLTNTTGTNNTANGSYTLLNNTTGVYNAAIGSDALHNNTTGNYNTANGAEALSANTTGSDNTAIGESALIANTTGSNNSATGWSALNFNTTGSYNSANGVSALNRNTTGTWNTANGAYAMQSNNAGSSNAAVGGYALYSNTTGYSNVAIGIRSLYSNTTASNLVAIGDSALYNNGVGATDIYDADFNTAVGSKAMFNNAAGFENTALGYESLYSSNGGTGGYSAGNNAIGCFAMYSNTIGSDNAALGNGALYSNTYGGGNTATGNFTLYKNVSGGFNTANGYGAGSNSDNLNNTTAIGYGALTTTDNQVRIGNNDVNSIGGYANWTNISDGRVKKNIKQNVPGLAFINKLNPITYNLDLEAADKIIQRPVIKDKDGKVIQPLQTELDARNAKEQIVYTGFVAQDVEKAAKSLNYDFSGVDAAKNDKDLYGLRYSDFVVPLVKAVQELSKMNDEKDARINALEARLSKIEEELKINASTVSFTDATLDQNIPNPFTHNTTIGYTLPQKFSNAQIVITDKNGNTLKALNVSGSGKGSVNVDASTLSSGAYQYSLVIDGRLVATKQMEHLK